MTTTHQETSFSTLAAGHWRLILFSMFSFIGLAGLVTMILPVKYESRMKFLVNNDRADLVISSEKNPITQKSEVTDQQVNSELVLLESRDILEQVVRNAKLYKRYEKTPSATPPAIAIESAVRRLEKDLDVSNVKKTNIIAVSYRNGDSQLAASVLRDLGERYLHAHLAAHSAPGTYQFFAEEVDKYRKQLNDARTALAAFHQRKQIFSVPLQQQATVERLSDVDGQLTDVSSELADQQNRLSENRKQLASVPERVTTQVRTIPYQSAAQQLQGLLVDLRNRRIDLAMKFKPGDRLLAELDQQIANTERHLAEIQKGSAREETSDLDTLHQSLKADQSKYAVALNGLQARQEKLTRARDLYLKRLQAIDADNLELQKLEQDEQEAQENYQLYLRRLVETRMANALDREKFANVAMIESPQVSLIPAFPIVPLNLAVGAMMGILAGLAVAFLIDTRRSPSNFPPAEEERYRTAHAFQPASGD